jgi:folate-binding protein YgfZ
MPCGMTCDSAPNGVALDLNDTLLESPLLEFHRAAGCELAPYFGVTLPARFSDPLSEHRTARQAVALIDTNFRSVFSLAGPDRSRYLNAVLTSNVRDLLPGQGTVGLLLNAQGHILAELETLACEDRILALGHIQVRKKTGEILEKFIIMDDVTLTDETAEYGTVAMEGPEASAIVHELARIDLSALPARGDFGAQPALGHTSARVASAAGEISCRVIRSSLFGFPGVEFLVPREALGSLWGALGVGVRAHGGAPIGYRALNALRLEAGVPWFGVDFDERQIPHEAALENTHISFVKGCYTGQEIVERVRSRGHVNRRRTGLQFSAADPPVAGAALTAAGAEAGQVTSAAFSPLVGTAIGMGYVRREHHNVGTALQCAEIATEVIELPLASAAPSSAAQGGVS